MKNVSSRVAATNVFFKLPAAMIDDKMGPHQAFIILSDTTMETHEKLFRDMSKMTSDVKLLSANSILGPITSNQMVYLNDTSSVIVHECINKIPVPQLNNIKQILTKTREKQY